MIDPRVPYLLHGPYNQIPFLFIECLKDASTLWSKEIFQNAMYVYVKDDLASVQRPYIFARLGRVNKNNFSGIIKGTIILEIGAMLKVQRQEISEALVNIGNYIELINIQQTINNYLCQRVFGLKWFGRIANSDYTQAYEANPKIKIEFDFESDIAKYDYDLQQNRYSIYSPNEVVYGNVGFLNLQIAVLNSLNEVQFVTS